MNDALQDYAKPYTFVRYSQPVTSFGEQVRPTPILNNGQPWTMNASIQVLKDFEILALPEAFRGVAGIKIYSDTKMQVADDATTVYGDRITYKGFIYEVKMEADWEDTDLPYYRYKAFRIIQNRSPQ